MQIKTFRARSLRDALAMVRHEFGAGASILHTREVAAGPVARLWRAPIVEVAATPDRAPLAEQAMRASRSVTPRVAERPPARDLRATDSAEPPTAPQDSTRSASVLLAELIAADFEGGFARDVVRTAEAKAARDRTASLRSALLAEINRRLPVAGPLATPRGRRVVALVGPTGVGKTTTLAKLAANARVRDGRRVGLVTVDTYRVAAVDQLRTYAQIIDLPMEVVGDPGEMRAAVDRLRDVDLLMIDTAGRSPRDDKRIDELRELLDAAAPDETHLVLSATAGPRSLRDTLERFAAAAPDRSLLTKLDEAPTLGHVAEPLAAARLPVSYLTDGQSVPEDIRVAQADSFAAGLLGGGPA